jgi:hypothetical protein
MKKPGSRMKRRTLIRALPERKMMPVGESRPVEKNLKLRKRQGYEVIAKA